MNDNEMVPIVLCSHAFDECASCVPFHSRLDEWVTLDKFNLETLQPCSTTAEDGDHSSAVRRRSSASATGAAGSSNKKNGEHPPYNNSSSITDTGESGGTTPTTTIAPFAMTGGNWHRSNSGDPATTAFEQEHEETTKVKNIEKIVMGSYQVAAWYYSPFPAEYSDVECLYVCEFCLSYMKKKRTLIKHRTDCACREPPGRRIYRDDDLAVYELDGKEHLAYCQKLCLLAKLFLDHKTLYYDVTPFYFYVITKVDVHGAHIVGYFSKEKVSVVGPSWRGIADPPLVPYNP
jgi:histone acetyltransferase MYST1